MDEAVARLGERGLRVLGVASRRDDHDVPTDPERGFHRSRA